MRTRILSTILAVLLACSVALSAEGKAAAAEQGLFGGSFADAVWTVLAFIVLLLVLGKFAWKPMLKGLNARETHIQQQIEAADASRKKAEKMLDDYKQQGLLIVQKATDQAHRLELELMEKARQEVLALQRKARADIEYARVAASQQLWEEAGDMLLQLSSEILGRAVTHEDNLRLICEAIDKLNQEHPQTNESR
jgi:F-type H+-transporting ATPase subunit b